MGLFGWLSRKGDRKRYDVHAQEFRWRRADSDPSDDVLPRFQNVGSDLGPLGISASRDRTKVRDAFSPTRPIQDLRLFAGRAEVLQTLIRSIEDLSLHVIIYGERGIGKTSLLHILTQLARDARYHVVYHSCGEEQTFSDTFRAVAQEIPLLYDGRFGPAAEETEKGGTLADMLPPGNFGASQMSDVFGHLANTRLLILLDEFDRSAPGTFRRNIAELIKNMSDRSVRVQIVIAGVAGNLAELIEHIPSIRRNIFGLRVPDMTTDEISQMIDIGEKISGLTFTEAAAKRIGLIANGSPYLGSLLSQYAGFAVLDAGGEAVDLEHIDSACDQVAEELRLRLSDESILATDRALAAGAGPTLLLLSGLSMRQMGRLDENKLASYFPTRPFGDVASDIRQRFDLLTEVPIDGTRRFTFVEEAVPVYLWVKLVNANDAVARRLTSETA